ncbi:MAG: hypothetical protein HON70_10530, partial [Lentisphaerae bacterium]|nr:hypothetical protein [Lentisphaerota bacterium]
MKRFATSILIAITICLGLGSPLPVWAQGEHAKARKEWMAGYVKLEDAEKAETAKDPVLALELFRDAQDIFHIVRKRYPSWNPSLLEYRLNYCTKRIKRLEAEVATASAGLDKPKLVDLAQDQAGKIKALTTQNRELRQRVELTAKALERARREAARAAATGVDVDDLVSKNRGLEEQAKSAAERVAKLQDQLRQAQAESGRLQKLEEAKEELTRTQTRCTDLEKALETYRKAYGHMKEKVREALRTEGELRAAKSTLGKESERLTTDLAQAQSVLRKAQDKQDVLRADSVRLLQANRVRS